MPNWSRTFQIFSSHSSVFAFEKHPKNQDFEGFLPLTKTLVANFSETCTPTSRRYLAEKGVLMST